MPLRACVCVRVRIHIYIALHHPFFGSGFWPHFWPKFYRHSTAPCEKPLFIGIYLIPHGLKGDFSAFFRLPCYAHLLRCANTLLQLPAPLLACWLMSFAAACAPLLRSCWPSRTIGRKYNIFRKKLFRITASGRKLFL
jgi:hypothetical protein